MKRPLRRSLLARAVSVPIALACALVALPGSAQTMREISFGIIATDSSTALKSMWEPFIADMSRETGLTVKAYFATDYAGIIEAQRFNKVQVAWYGNKSAIDAVDRANGEVFAQMVDIHGTPGYYSYLITHRDSGIKSLDEMFARGKELTYGSGDPQSTSGTLVPGYYVFTQRGLDPKGVFRVVRPANHGTNLLAVINRQVDVASNNSEELDKLKSKQPEKLELVRILWTSPLIPRDPLVWRADLPADVKEKVLAFVTSYGRDEREKEVLKNMYGLAGFKVSSNAQLIPIRQLELAKDRARFESDTTLSPADRQAKLADIDRKLAELAKTADVAKAR